MADYDGQGLELHHFYRAMAWLEKVEEKAADVLAVGRRNAICYEACL